MENENLIALKGWWWLGLVLAGTLMGSIYGILHDEVTYSLSPEFYTKVRFEKFNIDMDNPRVGVAKIGLTNTWLYSLLISALLSTTGLIHKDQNNFKKYTLQSFIWAILLAFILGLIGWLVAKGSVPDDYNNIRLTNTIQERTSFTAVQLVNNFSYMGGIAGMLVGVGWHLLKRKKDEAYFGRKNEDI